MKGRTFSDQYLSICELRNIDIVNLFPLQWDILVVCGRGRHRLSKSQQCSSHLAFVQTKNRIASEYELILKPFILNVFLECMKKVNCNCYVLYCIFYCKCYLFVTYLFHICFFCFFYLNVRLSVSLIHVICWSKLYIYFVLFCIYGIFCLNGLITASTNIYLCIDTNTLKCFL